MYSLKNKVLVMMIMLTALSSCRKDHELRDGCISQNQHLEQNKHPLEGYLDQRSYLPGEIIKLYVHCLGSSYQVTLSTLSGSPNIILSQSNNSPKHQNYSSTAFMYGCNWQETDEISLPANLSSGYYNIELKDGSHLFNIPFIVRPTNPGAKKILILSASNTWNAYNEWGGASFYKFLEKNNCDEKTAPILSFHRPNTAISSLYRNFHIGASETMLSEWLDANGFAYDVICDEDLNNHPEILPNYQVLCIAMHSEYWTIDMLNTVKAYINHGGRVMNLGANTCYWKVTMKGHELEVRKDYSKHQQTGEDGGHWRDLGFPEGPIFGVQFDEAGHNTFQPYQAINTAHWIFAHTSLHDGEFFGTHNLFGGASGWETDKETDDAPLNTILIARGTNAAFSGDTAYAGGACMVYTENAAGGAVFSTGSITYTGSLGRDPDIDQITLNVLHRFLR
jgi:G:T-mismatch repair DNA endonuclease (very short patch repair protein)